MNLILRVTVKMFRVVKSRGYLLQEVYTKDSDLLILDEFTSALDTELEKEIVENIK